MTTIAPKHGTANPMTETRTVIGQMIRELRARHDLSQMRLAHTADLSPTCISRGESGDRCPEPETLARIARAVGEDSSLLMIAGGYLPAPIVAQIESGQRTPLEIRNALFRVLTLES